MKLVIESTARRIILDGVSCSVWSGTTESGAAVDVLVHGIALPSTDAGVVALSAAEEDEIDRLWPAPETVEYLTNGDASEVRKMPSRFDASNN